MKWDSKSPIQSYIKIAPIKKVDGSYTSIDSGKFKTIAGFECRGLEISSWIPGADDFAGISHVFLYLIQLSQMLLALWYTILNTSRHLYVIFCILIGISSGGGKFSPIDLSDKEWTEYDEENDLSVSIMDLTYEIVKE